MSLVMFMRGEPKDERVNKNFELLRKTDWFEPIYAENESLFKNNEHLRYVVGWAKVEKALKNEKRSEKLKADILEAMTAKG